MLTNKLGLPKPFVDAATSDHEYTPNRYSVTTILGGTCEAILKRRHSGEFDEDVADRVWAIFGTAVHKVLQEAESTPDQMQENWLEVQLDRPLQKYSLSGIFDLYDDSTGTVTDWKTCSVWKCMVGDFDDWRRQVLLYCWMLQQAGFDAWNGEVVAIMRDHNKRKARTEKGYPEHPVLKVEWRFKGSDIEWAEDYVYDWFQRVSEQERLEDSRLEPCSPEQRWHKLEKWAVMRKGQKKAVKLFDDKREAIEFADWLMNQASNKGRMCRVEHRHGEDTKCEGYCSVSEWCPYMQNRTHVEDVIG